RVRGLRRAGGAGSGANRRRSCRRAVLGARGCARHSRRGWHGDRSSPRDHARPGAGTSRNRVKMKRVVIAGISTRAAAESAARAGFDVTAIDAFADLDQHPSVQSRSIPRPFTARAAARAARSIDCDAVAYLSNFENHPDDVRTLAAGRELWGNPPAVLRRVRDPLCLARALRDRGIAGPDVRLPPARVARRHASPTAVAEAMAVRRSVMQRRKQSEGGRPDTTGDARNPGTTTDHHD